MKLFSYCLITAAIIMVTTGCTMTHYAWQDYDQKLYNHYKNPAEYEQFVEDLKEVIEYGEKDGKVPPGIYAEYGYALYEKGNVTEAIKFFKKEQEKWPESNVLMSKMINNTQKKTAHGEKQKQVSGNNPAQSTEVAK